MSTNKDERLPQRDPSPTGTLAAVMLCTGLGPNELCALKWKDVSFKGHSITLEATVQHPSRTTQE